MKLASTKDDLFVFLGAAMIFSDIHISDRLEETKHEINDLQCFFFFKYLRCFGGRWLFFPLL